MWRSMIVLALAALLGGVSTASATQPEIRRFASDPNAVWYVFPGPVEAAFLVDEDSTLGCRGTLNAYLFFPEREMLKDKARVVRTAEEAMRRFADTLCKGEPPRPELPIWGFVRGTYRTDGSAFLESQDVQVWLQATLRSDGLYRIDVQRNLVVEEAVRGGHEAARKAKREAVCRKVAEERTGFTSRIGSLCMPVGRNSSPAAGIWAESPADCTRKAWVLAGSGEVELWTLDPEYGFAPDRAGTWTHRGDILALALQDQFTAMPDGAVVRQPKPETIQFQVDSFTDDMLKLTGFGGHHGRFALFRCDCSAFSPGKLPNAAPLSCKAGP